MTGRDDDATRILPVQGARPAGREAIDPDATAVFPAPGDALEGTAPGQTAPGDDTIAITAATGADSGASVARNSGIMAVASLISRVTGLLRTVAIAAAIGVLDVGDAYNLANMLPNIVYELLLGGILTSVLVPVIVKARKTDADGGDAFTHRLLTAATVLLAVATAFAVALAPLLTWIFANEQTTAASQDLTTFLAYLLLPEIFFYGIAALLAAVLNTRGVFGAPTFAPILNNLTVLVTAVVFIAVHGHGRPEPESITTTEVLILGIGTTLGIVFQALVLWPALRKVGFRWRWRFDLRGTGLGEAVRLGGWMIVYVAISQVGVAPVLWIANRAGDADGPGLAVHTLAFLLFMMVHGIVAVSILTALLPRMSAAATDGRFADVATNLSLGTRLSSVVLVPATAGYLVLGVPLAVSIFTWRAVELDDAHAIGLAVMAAGLGLVPFAISQMQIFAFYAMRDTKTPALLNIPVVAAKIVFDLGVLWLVPADYVVVGLMCGNTLSYVVSMVISARLLRRRVGSLDGARTTQTLTRLSIAAAVAGLLAWGVSSAVQAWLGSERTGSMVALVLGGTVLIAVFGAVAVFMRVREVTDVVATVRRKVSR